MTDFSTFVFKITKLKIDANPFASAYRRDGLHGQAKRYFFVLYLQVYDVARDARCVILILR